MSQRQQPVSFPIAAWSAWAPGIESAEDWREWAAGRAHLQAVGAPTLSFIDPMLRRRLGRTARMALHVARQCLSDGIAVPTVFSSRHGELHRTVGMLRHLAQGEDLSPTEFALSVHNAAAGVHAIARADRSASTSIVAGPETFAYGLLEAANRWLMNASQPVLFVYSDEPVPDEYRTFVPIAEGAHAMALLLSEFADTTVQMQRVATDSSDRSSAVEMQSFAFLRSLIRRDRETTWRGQHGKWRWSIFPCTSS